ncbi:MGDG synthase family glycosyltransferase [Neobacillus terrae]|uniref:MGDG synthase family glycosyltransferase n=1 Tax=Neobacillus terrae TaxID=3034837 RepID=UPI00140E1FEB|nr:glycosyltransferase [Neobacillus terrae]NHM30753.1 1,2-diacylglycerol 3-glucosyltransferase [Neobacillus terrae]
MRNGKKKKILILSANFGDGHKQVAKAITESVECSYSEMETETMDIMKWIHPRLNPLGHFLYVRGIKKLPFLYSLIYKSTRKPNAFSLKLNSILSSGLEPVLEIIKKINPTAVVSTYPFAAGIMSKLKEQGLLDVPIITVITDYTDHSYWLHPNTDLYLVGSKEIGERLVKLGVDPERIKDTGIPIRQQFYEKYSRVTIAEKYDFDPKRFTLLVMGGGDGLIGKGFSNLEAWRNLPEPIQIIIVCGRNRRLKSQLESRLKNSIHKIRIVGFCGNVAELMAVSDLMITKPGGVTTSEAIEMELPMLIYQPLPGQEEDNADFLLREGMAVTAKNEKDLSALLYSLVCDPKHLTNLKLRMKAYHRWILPQDPVKAILQSIQNN